MYSLPVSRTLVWRFTNAMDGVCPCNGMVVCPKFGHPVQSSDICKGKNNFTKIVNVLLVLKLKMVILLFSYTGFGILEFRNYDRVS